MIIFNVILGGFGGDESTQQAQQKTAKPVKQAGADDAAFLMKNASSVIIVPVMVWRLHKLSML